MRIPMFGVRRTRWQRSGLLQLTNYAYKSTATPIKTLAYGTNDNVQYTYNQPGAWGNVLRITGSAKDTIGVNNPLRYRGYIYDPETQLYYCQSRYYNPEVGRWLNADAFAATGQGLLGNNMFAYCNNNPVNNSDPSGNLYRSFHWQIDVLFFEGFGGIRTVKSAPIVVDVSASGPVIGTPTYWKVGVTFIADPTNTEINMYFHGGLGVGYSSGVSPSISVGTVSNYSKPKDGSGFTYDANIAYYLGVDHGWNPAIPYDETTKTSSITFSSGLSFGFGSDFYSLPICIADWRR